MIDLILYAVPFFVLLLAIEAVSFKIAAREDLKGYEAQGHPHQPEHGPGQRGGQRRLEGRGAGRSTPASTS